MKTILAELDRMATKGQLGKGKFFETVVKMILETAPEFQSQYRKVWLWDDYPDRGGADLGADGPPAMRKSAALELLFAQTVLLVTAVLTRTSPMDQ